MTKKQIYTLVGLAFFAVVVIVAGFLTTKNFSPFKEADKPVSVKEEIKELFGKNTPGANQFYTPEIPANATATVPDKTISIVNQPSAVPGAKFGTFQIKASQNGYSPSSITVKVGDTVEIDLAAEGGNFDIFSSSAGFYANASPDKSGRVSFLASTSGTFLFECRDACPSAGKIQGTLVVLPTN